MIIKVGGGLKPLGQIGVYAYEGKGKGTGRQRGGEGKEGGGYLTSAEGIKGSATPSPLSTFGPRASPLNRNRRLGPTQHDGWIRVRHPTQRVECYA